MIELVDNELRLDGRRVGVFIGTPSDRMDFVDALSSIDWTGQTNEELIAEVLEPFEKFTKKFENIAESVRMGYEDDDSDMIDQSATRLSELVDEYKTELAKW